MKKHPFTFGEMILIASCAAIVAALTVAAAKSAVDPKIAACADIVRGIDRKLAAWENDHDGKLIFVNAPKGGIWGRQLRDGGYFDADGFIRDNRNWPDNFTCPAETRTRRTAATTGRYISVNVGGTYDYGLNGFINFKPKPDQPEALKRGEIKTPEKTMRLTEGCNYAILSNSKHGTSRHGELSGNTLFFDGHVEFVKDVPFRDRDHYDRAFWFGAKR